MSTTRSPLFQFSWFHSYDLAIEELANMAMSESWSYINTASKLKYPILHNYIHHTFVRLQTENKVYSEGNNCVFNTGLTTENQEEIYAYFQKNRKIESEIEWFFVGFRKHSHRDLMAFSKLPERAHYFEEPKDLIYDTRIDLRVNVDHIIDDNVDRFPIIFKDMERHVLAILLNGAIEDTKKRIKRNYKTAIPQYFKGNLQLLLPLCLSNKTKADLALIVEKQGDIYRATTCLTLDMAINNARLIAKPDDEWLKP